MPQPPGQRRLLALIGPGIVVAATGVGAGDLATGAFAGSKLGVAVLWAVILGAAFKFLVNEGLARWQLATGKTLLEGVARHVGRWAIWLFLAYLLFWSYFVASALIGACGAAMHALLPWQDPATDKIVYGIAHSALAVVLVRLGGFKLFEWLMSACVGIMCGVVLASAVAIGPDWPSVVTGMFVPRVPRAGGEGLTWTLALIGGIGGTVTVLSYGYWIREAGREGPAEIPTSRIDLATGYAVTALFGLGMVIIGSELLDLQENASGTAFLIDLGKELENRLGPLGPAGRWGFVIGAWCAVFSSMLGVWQSVPYLFADGWRLVGFGGPAKDKLATVDTRSGPYIAYQLALASIPLVSLWHRFVEMQKIYAIIGAFFVPLLAAVLVILNGRSDLVGASRSRWAVQLVLLLAILFFVVAGVYESIGQLSG